MDTLLAFFSLKSISVLYLQVGEKSAKMFRILTSKQNHCFEEVELRFGQLVGYRDGVPFVHSKSREPFGTLSTRGRGVQVVQYLPNLNKAQC